MATKGKSRWADDEEDAALEAQRKKEKEEKKKAKLEKQRKLEEAEKLRQSNAQATALVRNSPDGVGEDGSVRPSKRRKITPQTDARGEDEPPKLLRFPAPEWGPCRHVDNFEKLNHIEEGSYGWVSRARETATGEIVALKKLKMDNNSNDGFPITGLREIQTLMGSQHENIVRLREVVMGGGVSEYFNICLHFSR